MNNFLLPQHQNERHNKALASSNGSSQSNSRNMNLSRGSNASKIDPKQINFDTSKPLDFETAIKNLSNQNKSVYYKILVKFVNVTLLKSMADIG